MGSIMATKLPYMASYGLVPKILESVQNARRPDRFTIDFLGTKLGHRSSGARPIIRLLKRMEFLGSDGIPTALYDQFRNPATQGATVAQGIKNAYSELFDRNEYANDLGKEDLTGLIMETTGAAKDDNTTRFTVSTFLALKEWADFDASLGGETAQEVAENPVPPAEAVPQPNLPHPPRTTGNDSVNLQVEYTINLNLPETTDPAVFDAIFTSLHKNLLKN